MERRRAARRIMDNPHPYYTAFGLAKHPEVNPEWIERTLIEPYRAEIQEDGRLRYWGAVPEQEDLHIAVQVAIVLTVGPIALSLALGLIFYTLLVATAAIAWLANRSRGSQ